MILKWVKGIKIPFISKPEKYPLPKIKISEREITSYTVVINELLDIGAISKNLPSKNNFLSPYFLATKPSGKKRFILNLKNLNNHILAPHFKLEDAKTVSKLLSKNCYLCSIDLQDAYFLLPIHCQYKKYLCFEFRNFHYQFNCLPFGLNIAPYIFTKLFKPVVSYLRLKGIFLVVYLDDILIIASSKSKCQKDTKTVMKLLKKLGFLINKEKSNLLPSQKIKYLGFIYNTVTMTRSLPQKKINSLEKIIKNLLKKSQVKIRDFARLVGSLVAACPAIKYGWMHMKALERNKYLGLKNNNKNYDKHMFISNASKLELKWWLTHLNNDQDIKVRDFALEIYTDASTSGWGAFCNGEKIHGFWDEREKQMHINCLEIKAAFYGLKSFTKKNRNIRVLLRIDNTTAISCINKGGSIKFLELNRVTKLLWDWCESRKLQIFASYIPSGENIEADTESRSLSVESEYELNDLEFKKIVYKFGVPNIDLFATKLNSKCEKYVSWFPDPDSVSVDAFTLKWSKLFFYAFPPFQIISKVLEKIKQDRATGILVVPLWTAQPWFPLFNELLVEDTLIFLPRKDLLISPFRNEHPLANTISLVAGKLSG